MGSDCRFEQETLAQEGTGEELGGGAQRRSWKVWLQRQEPQKVVSLSPGSSTFGYGGFKTDLGQLLAANLLAFQCSRWQIGTICPIHPALSTRGGSPGMGPLSLITRLEHKPES